MQIKDLDWFWLSSAAPNAVFVYISSLVEVLGLFCTAHLSQQKQPFLLTPHFKGLCPRRDVYVWATEILYGWRKMCPESGQELWLVDVVVLFYCFSYCLRVTKLDKRQKALMLTRWIYYKTGNIRAWNIIFFRRSIWVFLRFSELRFMPLAGKFFGISAIWKMFDDISMGSLINVFSFALGFTVASW